MKEIKGDLNKWREIYNTIFCPPHRNTHPSVDSLSCPLVHTEIRQPTLLCSSVLGEKKRSWSHNIIDCRLNYPGREKGGKEDMEGEKKGKKDKFSFIIRYSFPFKTIFLCLHTPWCSLWSQRKPSHRKYTILYPMCVISSQNVVFNTKHHH